MGKLSEKDIKKLEKNPFVNDVNETRIIYSDEFKDIFRNKLENGERPTQIFRDAGFDPKVIGYKRIERATYRWTKKNRDKKE